MVIELFYDDVDIEEKINVFRANYQQHKATGEWNESTSVHQQIEWEVKNNIQGVNGDNNAKVLSKDLKGQWQYTYNSTARNVIKMKEWLHFVQHMFSIFVNEPTRALSSVMTESYKLSMAPTNSFIINTAATIAMQLIGSKEWLFGAINIQASETERLAELWKNLKTLQSSLESSLKSFNCEVLP